MAPTETRGTRALSTLALSEIVHDLSPLDAPGSHAALKQGSLVRHASCPHSLGILIRFVHSHAATNALTAEVLWTTPPTLERFRIDSSGEMGIGTTCPSTKLRV